jgi:hypothetical protein
MVILGIENVGSVTNINRVSLYVTEHPSDEL